MANPPDCMSVLAGMTSRAESTRKLAAYHLQSLVADAAFADAFVQADGMTVLNAAVLEESGNALAYALGSLTKLLEADVGWESMGSEMIERAVQLVISRPSINVLRNALYLLVLVVSRPIDQATSARPTTPSSTKSFGLGAVMPILQEHDSFLDCLIDKLGSADHALCANALDLINALTRDSIIHGVEDEWPQLNIKMQELGVLDAIEGLMRSGALPDLAVPLLEFQSLTKTLLARWRGVRIDPQKAEHRAALEQLHVSSFRPGHSKSYSNGSDASQLNGLGEDQASDKWRRLGFQTEKPARAFEDAGFLGLVDLSEYVRRDFESFQNTLLEQSVMPLEQRCPVARASLSVTMLLCEYFNVESATEQGIVANAQVDVEGADVERQIQPLLLRWDLLHCTALGAFLKLWKESGAVIRDYHKIEDLTRLLIGNVLGRSSRKGSIEQVEQDILGVSLNVVRSWQLTELEEAYTYAWGADYEKLRDQVHGDALQFLKEQRIRCLLKGSWFPILTPSPVSAGHPQSPPDTPRAGFTSWRFVRLSHDRLYLRYATHPQRLDRNLPVHELPQKIDLNTISSVDSSVSRSMFPVNPEQQAAGQPGLIRNGTPSSSSTVTSLTIYGTSSASSSDSEEKVLLELSIDNSSLASEWLDGLLMLLNQQPITADTNKLIETLKSWTLKVRMFNLRWEDVDWQQVRTGEEKALPARPADREYWYEMGE